MEAAAGGRAAATWLQAAGWVGSVVGDRKLVEPQLDGLGLPVEIRPAPTVDSKGNSGE